MEQQQRPLAARRLAIYARFSSDKQNDKSIEDQVYEARERIRALGGDPDSARVLTDYAISAASMDRPGAQALMSLIVSGAIDVLVSESVDRISRDVGDSDRVRKLLAYHGVELVCLDGTHVKPGDRGAALLFGVKSLFAEQFLADLAHKVRRGMSARAREGLSTGRVQYGYKSSLRDPGNPHSGYEISVDPDKSGVVVEIFERYARGFSSRQIALHLNARGVTSPRGTQWQADGIREILNHKIYIGTVEWGRKSYGKIPGENRRKAKRATPIVAERPELAIVPLELWERCNARRTGHRGGGGHGHTRRGHVLSGLMRCGACGGPVVDVGGSKNHRYCACAAAKLGTGKCGPRVTFRLRDVVETFVTGLAEQGRELQGELTRLAAEEIEMWSARSGGRERDALAELAQLDREIDRLAASVARTGSERLEAMLVKAEARRSELSAELKAIKASAPKMPDASTIAARVASWATLKEMPPEAAREIAKSVLAGGVVTLHYEDGRRIIRWGLLGTGLLDYPLIRANSGIDPEGRGWPEHAGSIRVMWREAVVGCGASGR